MKIESVYFELTNRCNLNCSTCFNRSGLHTKTQELPFERLRESIGEFQKYGCKSVLLSGGEPLLYTERERVYGLIRRESGIKFILSTNGTVHDAAFLDAYRENRNLFVQISLDGASESVNAKTRGEGSYARAVAFLESLHACGEPYRYRIKMVISQHNKDDLEAYFALAQKYGCVPEFAFVSCMGNGSDHWDALALSADEKMRVLHRVRTFNERWNIEAKMPFCETGCPLADGTASRLSLLVKTNGNIIPCQGLYDDSLALGNICAFSAEQIREACDRLGKTVKKRMECDYGCKTCLMDSVCKRGCPAMAYNHSGDLLANDGQCEYRLRQYLKYMLRS